MSNEDDLFTKFGLEVSSAPVEVGQVYPLYGMITNILEPDESKPVQCVINFNILVTMYQITADKLETLRIRAFEPGIFVTKIIKVNEPADSQEDSPIQYVYEGECSTVVFGRSQNGLEV